MRNNIEYPRGRCHVTCCLKRVVPYRASASCVSNLSQWPTPRSLCFHQRRRTAFQKQKLAHLEGVRKTSARNNRDETYIIKFKYWLSCPISHMTFRASSIRQTSSRLWLPGRPRRAQCTVKPSSKATRDVTSPLLTAMAFLPPARLRRASFLLIHSVCPPQSTPCGLKTRSAR